MEFWRRENNSHGLHEAVAILHKNAFVAPVRTTILHAEKHVCKSSESLPDVGVSLFPEHYWLVVDGHIFDPTAVQWKSDPRREWFKVTKYWSKARVLKELPDVERPESDGEGSCVADWARRLQEYLVATTAQQSLTFDSHLTISA